MQVRRVRVQVRGAVQGVGFRPFVFGLAQRLGLAGFVRNEPDGVTIEAEGGEREIDSFVSELTTSTPPLARIQELRVSPETVRGECRFEILPSGEAGVRSVLIAPDRAPCADCLREFRDPADRRYRYAFINCTNCGPRYTIITGLPYDRGRTTMAPFAMCPACRSEYENPHDRRFHAEPVCCAICGPRVELYGDFGDFGDTIRMVSPKSPKSPKSPQFVGDAAVRESIRLLSEGGIAAVKGLGGFHLACDAANGQAVRRLRDRKHRDLKPFAVMVRDAGAAQRICRVTNAELRLLSSQERPIVLLRKRADHGLAEEVAPRNVCFGVLLPYTPLHELLLEGPFSALVMTSGNLSDEPIAYADEDARERLRAIADAFLEHDRAIAIRTDDSVLRHAAGAPRFLRRSRGYAPFPLPISSATSGGEILAVGAELSNTVCLTRDGQAYMSHHIGDLDNLAAYESFLQAAGVLKELLGVAPAVVAHDEHPSYASTRYARACGLPLVAVQHHHAHIASVLAETRRTEPVIGVAFDGMGWGGDATLWGGEFLVCDLGSFERVAYLEPMPQPGGDAAARRPDRMAYVYLRAAFGERANALARELLPNLTEQEMTVVSRMIAANVHTLPTSSAGRLFDAVSALLGICGVNTYHAQAPMELEGVAAQAVTDSGGAPAGISLDGAGRLIVHGRDLVRGTVEDLMNGAAAALCAARFHAALARTVVEVCRRIREARGLECVALSGGVFANALLLDHAHRLLSEMGFEVLLNSEVPAGDGGISLGQAAVAAWRRACA